MSPTFHGYWRSIRYGLEQCGHEVVPVIYDERDALTDKIFGKVRYDLPRHLGRDPFASEREHATARVARQLGSRTPDMMLVVRGDVIDPSWVEAMRKRGTRTVLWLYDELRRTHLDADQLGCYDVVATYSPSDAANIRLTRDGVLDVPLAYDERLVAHASASRTASDLLFVGARYANREQLLLRLIAAGIDVRAFGRDWSRHPIDRVRSLSWRRPAIPSGRDLTRSEAADATAQAHTTINIHGDQDGFTMRTFEVCGVGGLQLIDRPDVSLYYEPGAEVIVFETISDIAEAVGRANRDARWSTRVRQAGRRRTLAHHTFRHRCEQLVSAC